MAGYIYFVSNRKYGTLYLGVTSHLAGRIDQHKKGEADGFTKRYSLTKLVYTEAYEKIEEAIQREKQLKNWKRDWKIALIDKVNPEWKDLYAMING